MQNSLALILSIPLWAASMFVKLEEYRQRGEIVRIYVYSNYGWLVALAREPDRFLREGRAFMAGVVFLCIDLLHMSLCFVLAWVLVWLVRRIFFNQAGHRSSGRLAGSAR